MQYTFQPMAIVEILKVVSQWRKIYILHFNKMKKSWIFEKKICKQNFTFFLLCETIWKSLEWVAPSMEWLERKPWKLLENVENSVSQPFQFFRYANHYTCKSHELTCRWNKDRIFFHENLPTARRDHNSCEMISKWCGENFSSLTWFFQLAKLIQSLQTFTNFQKIFLN